MQSVIHSCIVSHCVISRTEVIVSVHECENGINVAIRITVFTQASDSLFFWGFFQPCSNKAEKFDYVSRRSFLSSSSLLRPWIYKTGLYSILHTYDLFFFVRQGHGVCEKDDRPRVCGIQQCHVSVLSNAFKVFYVNISLFCGAKWKKQNSARQIARSLPCCIIDVWVVTYSASLSQVPVRKRNGRQKLCHWILHERKEGQSQDAEIWGIINVLLSVVSFWD